MFNDDTRTCLLLSSGRIIKQTIENKILFTFQYLNEQNKSCNFFRNKRILNHLLALIHTLWMLVFNTVLMGLRRTRKINGIYERVNGARMHAAYFRPGG